MRRMSHPEDWKSYTSVYKRVVESSATSLLGWAQRKSSGRSKKSLSA